jgi:hypothetical protein
VNKNVTLALLVAVGGMTTLATAGAVLLATAAPANAATPPVSLQVSASPVPGTPLGASGGHSVILLPLAPGESSTQSLHLVNPQSAATAVVVRGVDGFTDAATGFGFTSVDQDVNTVGTWITVSTPKLTLEPGESRDVSFTVTVPTDARSGQHLGGVAVYSPVTQASEVTSDGKVSVQMIIQPQRVFAVQVEVPGDAIPRMTVSGVRPAATADGVALGIALTNSGTAIAQGRGVLSVPSTGLRAEFPIVAFVPGTSMELTLPWTRQVQAGQHDVQVQLFYDDDRTTNWTGTVDVSGETLSRLRSDLAEKTVVATPTQSWMQTNRWWLLGAVIVVIIGFLVALRRPRSHRRVVRHAVSSERLGAAGELARLQGAAETASGVANRIGTVSKQYRRGAGDTSRS